MVCALHDDDADGPTPWYDDVGSRNYAGRPAYFFFVPRKIIVCINVRTARNVSFHALEDADGSGNQSCLDSSVVPVDAYHLGHFSAQVNRFHSQ